MSRSKLDVHVHLHGKFADILPEEIHVHLHADRDAGPDDRAATPRLGLRQRQPEMMRLGNTIQKPMSLMQTKVRAVDSTPGVICCVGFAMSNGHIPDQVFAKCYHADPGDPSVLPIPLDAVEGLIFDNGTSNYFFDHQSGSQEIPNVLHSLGGGVQNWIVVWPVYGTTVKDIKKRSFYGVTATETECEPSGGYTVLRQRLQVASPGPSRYRVRPSGGKGHASVVPSEIIVQHCQRESSSTEAAWTTAAAKNVATDCILWITQADDCLQGTLALRGVMGSKLTAPVVYRCADWQPDAKNTLVPDQALPKADALPKLIVEPE